MKILIINYVYFLHGGPSRYMFNLKDTMESKGHTVIPFSINFTKNEYSEYSKYFVPPISDEETPFFVDFHFNFRTILKGLERLFYSKEVYQKLNDLIAEQKPDFALLLPYLKKLSPSVLVALKDNSVPFAVRLSDFNMFCGNGLFFRNEQPCELCLTGSRFNEVKYKCVKDSYIVSSLDYLAFHYHKYKKYFDLIETYIVPTKFLERKMIESGFPASKIYQINTFVSPVKPGSSNKKKKKILYIGRLIKYKGVEVLLAALSSLNEYLSQKSIEVVIVGEGEKMYEVKLKSIVEHKKIMNVTFVGKKNKSEINTLLEESLFSVIPSLWYDNMPNSLLESYAAGVPVIASNQGCFPEIVKNDYNGILFEPNSAHQLSVAIKTLLEDEGLRSKLGKNAKEYVDSYHNPEYHYERIMELYRIKTGSI